jgi:hypothetical protein
LTSVYLSRSSPSFDDHDVSNSHYRHHEFHTAQ